MEAGSREVIGIDRPISSDNPQFGRCAMSELSLGPCVVVSRDEFFG